MPDRFPREANVVVEVAVRLVRKKGVIDSESRNVADRKTPLHVRECRLHTEPAGSHVPGCRNQGRCAAPSRRVRVTVDRKNVCARRRSPDAQPGLGRGAPSRACGGGRQGHRHGCGRMTCHPRLQDGDQRRHQSTHRPSAAFAAVNGTHLCILCDTHSATKARALRPMVTKFITGP